MLLVVSRSKQMQVRIVRAMFVQGKIKSLEQIYLFSMPVKEYQIVEAFLGSALKDEVMKIMPVQKQTRAGQRTRFKAFVVVGDHAGHVGLGVKCAKEVSQPCFCNSLFHFHITIVYCNFTSQPEHLSGLVGNFDSWIIDAAQRCSQAFDIAGKHYIDGYLLLNVLVHTPCLLCMPLCSPGESVLFTSHTVVTTLKSLQLSIVIDVICRLLLQFEEPSFRPR